MHFTTTSNSQVGNASRYITALAKFGVVTPSTSPSDSGSFGLIRWYSRKNSSNAVSKVPARSKVCIRLSCCVASLRLGDTLYPACDDQLPEPAKSSVYDAVSKLDDYEVIAARYSQKIADEKYRAVLQGPRPTRQLERVECDHTITDLFVIDPVMMLPIGRAFLTWMICVYTKMILGFYISFNPPSYLTVMECLKHAIRPKTYMRRKYSSIKNDWNPYGIPEVLVVDNAREFHGRNLEDACHQLGIVLQFGQRGKPWMRPSVERSYRTVATKLHHQLPGTTFSNILEKGDYEPGKTAIITPDVLDEITHKWLADVYQVSPHRGIRDVPAVRWEKGISEWPPI
jgi:putative transposase